MATGRSRTAPCDRCARSRRRVAELEAEFQRLRAVLVDVGRAAADPAGAASSLPPTPTGAALSIGLPSGRNAGNESPPLRASEPQGQCPEELGHSNWDVNDSQNNAEFIALVEEGNRLSITVDTIIRSQIFELKDLC
jgi:hypothetical protein